MSAAIDIRDLFRVYSTPEGDAAALQGLSLTVREREIVVVLGPSGSGKTTLLRILAGLDRPSAGSVRVFGGDITKLSGGRLGAYRTATLGYVDQHYWQSLAAELTARQLVALELGLLGSPRRERLARADELLERVGLLDKRDTRPAELSGGEQQRLAVCAALAHRPRLLLADEPTGELDHANADLVYELIGELAREQGCTALIVSHDPESATIADRIVRIRDGRVSEESARTDSGDVLVVGRGWLRLPEEFLLRAGIRDRARAELREGSIVVRPAGNERPGPEAPPAAPAFSRREEQVLPDSPRVELRSLAKTYGAGASATTALTDLSATFEAAKLYAVTGPSGSGKTTLLHLLAGLDLPSAGEISILGTTVSSLDRRARADFRRDHLALVGQQPGLVPFLSAREHVELALALRQWPAAESRERALDALEAVGLTERAEQRVSRLSAGEQERVAIARALAARPEVLLADEPTSRLDQANALAVATLLSRLARESGTTVLCATHDRLVLEQADDELPLDRLGPSEARRPASRRPVRGPL